MLGSNGVRSDQILNVLAHCLMGRFAPPIVDVLVYEFCELSAHLEANVSAVDPVTAPTPPADLTDDEKKDD